MLLTWGTNGHGDGEFDIPIGIAVNQKDEILVTDFRQTNADARSRVQRFDQVALLTALSFACQLAGIVIGSYAFGAAGAGTTIVTGAIAAVLAGLLPLSLGLFQLGGQAGHLLGRLRLDHWAVGEREQRERDGQRESDAPLRDLWTYHAVADAILAHSLLRAQPEVDPDRIGLTGISGGGACSFHLACADERVRAVSTLCGISTPRDAIRTRTSR